MSSTPPAGAAVQAKDARAAYSPRIEQTLLDLYKIFKFKRQQQPVIGFVAPRA
jgi:hypothetical protein